MEKDTVIKPLLDFKGDLENLIAKAISSKTVELDDREKELTRREVLVEQIFKNAPKTRPIQLRVGNIMYYTTSDVLCSSKDSFFHGLLNPNLKQPEDGIYFIPRDGEVFKYVLEYLSYGELITKVSDKNILDKLVLDSDFYLLPELKNQAMEQVSKVGNKAQQKSGKAPVYLKLNNGTHGGNGQYWQWNGHVSIPSEYFSITTTSYTNDTINIKKDGDFLVTIRTSFTNSGNSVYLALYNNGGEIARSYNAFNTNYSASTHITEIFPFKSGDKLQVYQTYNNGPMNGGVQNQVSILLL